MESDILKITLLGDYNVGKTCFLFRLVLNDFPTKHVPTTFPGEVHAPSYKTDNGCIFTLGFNEPAGGEDFHRLRPLSYPGTDLFVIFYDVSKRKSLQNTPGFYKEVTYHTPNTPVLLLGNKTDLRISGNEEECEDKESIISLKEANEVAKTMNTICVECSSLSGEGVHEAACVMVHMAVYGQKPITRGFFKKKGSKRQKIDIPLDSLILDSSEFYGMDNAPQCPGVNVLPSRSVEDLARMIDDTTCKDVRFILQDNSTVDAHQIILIIAAPKLFQEILTGTAKTDVSGLPHELFEKIAWPIPTRDSENNNSSRMVEIRVCDKIKRKEFLKLLEFLYAGASITDLKSGDSIQELLDIAKTFNLPELLTACENVLEGNELENMQKTTFVGGEKATILKNLFLKKPLLEDLVFQVEGNLVYAHQAVIVARSHVLAAMVTSYRRQNPGCIRVKIEITDVNPETFGALLEYLYTDEIPKEDGKEVLLDLLAVANKYNLPRLVTLCEYRLILKVQEISDRSIAVSAVIDIFSKAKNHKAQQLTKWCLNLIARNYLKFSFSKEIPRLNERDREYVEQHQWPQTCHLPTQHTFIVEQYLAKRKRQFQEDSTTRCAIM